jgi:hypothetical protein
MDTAPDKPLGRKAYGSTPHLPGSRLGPGDHHCHAGQATICTERVRDRHDRVIVTEKLDGSNVAVCKIGGEVVAVNRAGYRCATSPWEQHRLFDVWVGLNRGRFGALLREGERACGEWLAQAHGTVYRLPHEPFVAFALMAADRRAPWDETAARLAGVDLVAPRVLHDGGPLSIPDMLARLEPSGHGAAEPVEGAVWRVERRGAFDFIAKWVRPDKQDGKYLPDVTGHEAIWHWRP